MSNSYERLSFPKLGINSSPKKGFSQDIKQKQQKQDKSSQFGSSKQIKKSNFSNKSTIQVQQSDGTNNFFVSDKFVPSLNTTQFGSQQFSQSTNFRSFYKYKEIINIHKGNNTNNFSKTVFNPNSSVLLGIQSTTDFNNSRSMIQRHQRKISEIFDKQLRRRQSISDTRNPKLYQLKQETLIDLKRQLNQNNDQKTLFKQRLEIFLRSIKHYLSSQKGLSYKRIEQDKKDLDVEFIQLRKDIQLLSQDFNDYYSANISEGESQGQSLLESLYLALIEDNQIKTKNSICEFEEFILNKWIPVLEMQIPLEYTKIHLDEEENPSKDAKEVEAANNHIREQEEAEAKIQNDILQAQILAAQLEATQNKSQQRTPKKRGSRADFIEINKKDSPQTPQSKRQSKRNSSQSLQAQIQSIENLTLQRMDTLKEESISQRSDESSSNEDLHNINLSPSVKKKKISSQNNRSKITQNQKLENQQNNLKKRRDTNQQQEQPVEISSFSQGNQIEKATHKQTNKKHPTNKQQQNGLPQHYQQRIHTQHQGAAIQQGDNQKILKQIDIQSMFFPQLFTKKNISSEQEDDKQGLNKQIDELKQQMLQLSLQDDQKGFLDYLIECENIYTIDLSQFCNISAANSEPQQQWIEDMQLIVLGELTFLQ